MAAGEGDRTSLERARQLFAVLHNLGCPLCWELVGTAQGLYAQVAIPRRARPILDGQFAAAYPEAELEADRDALQAGLESLSHPVHLLAAEYHQLQPFYVPLLLPEGSRDHDPLAAVLLALCSHSPEVVTVLQLLAIPAGRGCNEKGGEAAPAGSAGRASQSKLSQPLYKVSLRAACLSSHRGQASLGLQGLDAALRQLNTTGFNGLQGERPQVANGKVLAALLGRQPLAAPGFLLCPEELAQAWHLPWGETPLELYRSRGHRAPASLTVLTAAEGLPLGSSSYRGQRRTVLFRPTDRRQHTYLIGATRTGKTTMMENMIAFDTQQGHGLVVVDPHGDLARRALALVPPGRRDDVIDFEPANVDCPLGFNPLDEEGRPGLVASELMQLFRLLWGSAWGPRMNDILYNCLLTLLELPGATLADLPSLLTSVAYRQRVLAGVSSPVVREFRETRFNRWAPSLQVESTEPILNKVNAFLTDPLLYRVVSQSRSGFRLRQVMDEGLILICNLSRGRLGDESAALLGGTLLAKVEAAALSRADRPEDRRRDVNIYVDEFQRMATRSFVSMFSELAKYHASLVVANQFCGQLPEEVRSAIFGNVGTLISYRVGPDDAPYLARYFAPVFRAEDLLTLDNFRACVRLTANGQVQRPFSLEAFGPPDHPWSEGQGAEDLVRHTWRAAAGDQAEAPSKSSAGLPTHRPVLPGPDVDEE